MKRMVKATVVFPANLEFEYDDELSVEENKSNLLEQACHTECWHYKATVTDCDVKELID